METAELAVRVAAIQMCSGNDKWRNLAVVDALLKTAAAEDCRLAVLPENFAFVGAADHDKLAHAEEEGTGPVQDYLRDAARRYGLWIIAGSLPLRSGQADRCFGASMAFDERGELRGCYRKMHLFDVDLPEQQESYRESASMAHGAEPVTIDTVIGRLGMSICYDVRFPELYRRLTDDGAVAFSIPAAFTSVTGAAHWQVLLRARAIENLAYVIAPGQFGQHPNGRRTYGHTLIVDPWGRVLAEQDSGEGVVMATLETAMPGRLRQEFPALQHRRLK
ncbi:MAG TPA: carbon-nitrogen hydrolase family protein [Woeseiaceae bacterium]|nr:carbon-nitrogen hydrolase family protein [Woeseiaceae bacterium]